MSASRKTTAGFIGIVLITVLVFSFQAIPTSAQGTSVQSDDFESPTLNPVWTQIVSSDGSTVSLSNGELVISVPAGIKHSVSGDDPLTFINGVVGVSQPIPSENFEVVIQFNSGLAGRYQIQGILIEQDPLNLIRFDFHSYQTGSIQGTSLYAAKVVNGQLSSLMPNVRHHLGDNGISPLWMKINAVGDASVDSVFWTLSYKLSETDEWVTPFPPFKVMLWTSKITIFAGNSDDPNGVIPAHTARVEYFTYTGSGGVLPTPVPTVAPSPMPTEVSPPGEIKLYLPLTLK